MNRTRSAGKGAAFGAAYSLLVLVTVTCDRPTPQPTAPQKALPQKVALGKAAAGTAAVALPGTTDPQVFIGRVTLAFAGAPTTRRRRR